MNKNMDIAITIAGYFFLLVSLLFWAFICFRLLRYPENHVGWNVLWSIGLFLPLTLIAAVQYFLTQTRFSLAVTIFALISCVLVFLIYHFNILIPYEVWLKRGMPSRPF